MEKQKTSSKEKGSPDVELAKKGNGNAKMQPTRRQFLGGMSAVTANSSASPKLPSRREFIKKSTLMTAAGWAASSLGVTLGTSAVAQAVEVGPPSASPSARASQLQQIRTNAAVEAAQDEVNAFPHPTNGDEELYQDQNFVGNFLKTMPVDSNGLVVPSAYQALIAAAEAGTQTAFQSVPLAAGGVGKFIGPVDGPTFNILGPDTPGLATPAFAPLGLSQVIPPPIASAQAAAEMVELYWEAICRDVPFIDFASNPLIAQAVTDISNLSGYQGPTPVTPQSIFRYQFADALNGPYVSQFLYQTHRFDGVTYVPMINTRTQVTDPNTGNVLGTGFDYVTNLAEYINAEQTVPYAGSVTLDPTPRFVRSVRDLGQLAASDSIFSIYFRAAIIANAIGLAVSPNNPFVNDPRSVGFGSFGGSHLFELVAKAEEAERHGFYFKWYVHRHLRPENFSNLVDGTLGNKFGGKHRFTIVPTLSQDLVNSAVLPLIFTRNQQLNSLRGFGNQGSLFLPQELATADATNTTIRAAGSPTHPSAPSGHAITAGACVTMLKAWFDTTKPWPLPVVVANEDGSKLVPADGTGVTVLGELNKLAFNIAEGRNMSGIHWRISDNLLGLLLGEQLAIEILTEAANVYSGINFTGWSLTKFDGTTILINGTDFF